MKMSDEVKRNVSCVDACRRYGIDINRSGFARCIWHDDNKPSMRVYPGDRGVHCFSCGANGSVIDLVMKLFDLSAGDACRRIAEDFCLNIPDEKPLSNSEKLAQAKAEWNRKQAEKAKQAKHAQLQQEFCEACDHLRGVESTIKLTAPTDQDDEWSDEFCRALMAESAAQYRADEAMRVLNEPKNKGYIC